LILAIAALAACGGEASPTPDAIATHVALEQAVAATLTAAATPEDGYAIATGVAIQKAIALTLTAEAPTATPTPVALPTSAPDLVATGVAVERAVAATLVANATLAADAALATAAAQTPSEPEPSTPVATAEPSRPPATAEPAASIAPTGTKEPTATPAPVETEALPTCISWRDAGAYIGTSQCVCGVVTGTYDDPNSSAFFINFEPDRVGYYAISFEHTFTGLEGRCVIVCGIVEDFRGRPQTIINSLDQIEEYPSCP
jgi:hypothetical protein